MSHIPDLSRQAPVTPRRTKIMTTRTNPYIAAPDLLKAWMAFSDHVGSSGLEKSLLELVKIRASQINGCANCLNMHSYEARQAGETEQRIAVLAAWHEAPLYTDRERAALAWTEHLTLVADKRAPQHVYVRLAMSAPELGSRTLYANLGRAAGQDDEDSYALIWNPGD